MLVVLILVFGPISGAHFNPAVTGVMLLRGEITEVVCAAYIAAQVLGAVLGRLGGSRHVCAAVARVLCKGSDGSPAVVR